MKKSNMIALAKKTIACTAIALTAAVTITGTTVMAAQMPDKDTEPAGAVIEITDLSDIQDGYDVTVDSQEYVIAALAS